MLFAVAGLITSDLDLLILGAALAGGEVLLSQGSQRPSIRRRVTWLPYSLRVLVAALFTFLTTMVIGNLYYDRLGDSEFFPLVLALSIGLLFARPLLEMPPADRSAPPPTGGSASPLLLLLLAMGLRLLLPAPALAHHCANLEDCAAEIAYEVGVALSAILSFLWSWVKGVFLPKVPGSVEPLLSPEGAEMQCGAMEALRERVAKDVLAETGDAEEYYRIRHLTMEEFYNEAQTGKWDGLNARGGDGNWIHSN